jgi:hypothetical protein
VTARLCAVVECSSCGSPRWGDNDNIPALRASLADDGWQIDPDDICTSCLTDAKKRDLLGHEGWLQDHVAEAFHEADGEDLF